MIFIQCMYSKTQETQGQMTHLKFSKTRRLNDELKYYFIRKLIANILKKLQNLNLVIMT